MNKYHERALRSFAFGDIAEIFCRYKGGAKEVTESWAMLEAAQKYCPNLSEYKVVVVGDGASPRTGSLLAYFTKADVISVDPGFNMKHYNWWKERREKLGEPPQRLELRAVKIEDTEIDCGGKKLLVIWPHSHAPMNGIKVEGFASRTDIAMPCCVKIPTNLLRIPHIVYEDQWVESPHRTIHVWQDL
jgi:hypothetical protein